MNRKACAIPSWYGFGVVCWLLLVAVPVAAQQRRANPLVYPILHSEMSPPLRQIPPVQPKIKREIIPLRRVPRQTSPAQPDPVVQSTAEALVQTSTPTSFEGLGNGFPNYSVGVAPPDTNGAVGTTQYIQWVNLSYEIFDKSTHTPLYGPFAGNTIWQGSSLTACAQTNDGDPIVQFDSLAQRWVMVQLSYSSGSGYYECIAISASDDAMGSWYRYALQWSSTLPDYPKLGVWPDGYYVTQNLFFGGVLFLGGQVCALDRSKMLDNLDATAQCYTLSSNPSLLPATVDGPAPPSGEPEFIMDLGSNSLNLWKFHVNFANPNGSAFTGPVSIPVAPFTEACGGGTCIPQPGTTQQLDTIGERLMYRLAYRNFGDHESLVTTHSVKPQGGSNAASAIRWYEIRSPNTSPTVFQQGTYSPDDDSRWMGSIAMDKAGNIAVGYSVSSSTTYPSIRYTGRVSTDSPNTLEGEAVVVDGHGSQLPTLNRWGDYSAMAVDPVDGCTFWYTNEYMETSGTFNWHTRIATFSFPSCTGGTTTPDFSLSPSPASQSITQGDPASYTITVSSVNSFSGTVNLQVGSGCPTNATCSVTPSVSVPSDGSADAILSITNTGSTPAATYSGITVTADDGGSLTHSTSVSLTVNAVAAGDFSISVSPGNLTLNNHSSSGSYTASVTPSGGFTSDVTVTAACPSGVTCDFGGGSAITTIAGGNGSAVLTVTESGASRGNYTVDFTATSDTAGPHSTSAGLKVR